MWQILQVCPCTWLYSWAVGFLFFLLQVMQTSQPGVLRLTVPRIFYLNRKKPLEKEGGCAMWRKVNRILPRSRGIGICTSIPCLKMCISQISTSLWPIFRLMIMLPFTKLKWDPLFDESQKVYLFKSTGSSGFWRSDPTGMCLQCWSESASITDTDCFNLSWLSFKTLAIHPYRESGLDTLKYHLDERIQFSKIRSNAHT
jgi:hypothetical protein